MSKKTEAKLKTENAVDEAKLAAECKTLQDLAAFKAAKTACMTELNKKTQSLVTYVLYSNDCIVNTVPYQQNICCTSMLISAKTVLLLMLTLVDLRYPASLLPWSWPSSFLSIG